MVATFNRLIADADPALAAHRQKASPTVRSIVAALGRLEKFIGLLQQGARLFFGSHVLKCEIPVDVRRCLDDLLQ